MNWQDRLTMEVLRGWWRYWGWNTMTDYTVIGFFPSTNGRFADVYQGETASEAEDAALTDRKGLIVVGVVAGEVRLVDTWTTIRGVPL